MFSIRIVTTDHYQGIPIPGLDVQYADFRGAAVKKVPVIRVFGSTPQGQKTCMHVHGVFPYLYVPYDGTQPWDRYLRLFANSLDKALNVAQGNASAETQHVYKITLVAGIPMYGYHEKEQQFLKIYFYNPNIVRRAADLLLGGAVLNKGFQPHESHIPYTLQMFIDYNLYGMNMLNVAAVKFRRKAQDENANPQDDRNRPASNPTTPTSPDGSLQDWLNNASLSQPTHLWNADTITRDLYLESDVLRQSTCELEVDVVAADILNRLEVDANIGTNPGLAALWEDERQRKRNLGQSSQITPQASQDRDSVEISDSDQTLSDRFREIVLSQLPYIDSQSDSMSESSQEEIIPTQSASSVDFHSSQYTDETEASQSTIILDEEEEENRAGIVNMDSIQRVISMSQHFSATPLSQQSDEPQDRSLAALLASLADDSSPPASQAAAGEVAVLEEKDSILLEAAVVPDEETADRDEAETLEMSQVVWEEGSPEEEQREGQGAEFDLEGLDTTWNDSQAAHRTEEDRIPQFDGADDEKPPTAKKSKKKRLGTTGPVISGPNKASPQGQIPQGASYSGAYNNSPQNMYGGSSSQYPYSGQGYSMDYGGNYPYNPQWNPQGSYSGNMGFGMQGWEQTVWDAQNTNVQQQLSPEGQGLTSPQGHSQQQVLGNPPLSQNSPQFQRSVHNVQSPQCHPSPHSVQSPQCHPSPQDVQSPQCQPSSQNLQSPHGLNSPQGTSPRSIQTQNVSTQGAPSSSVSFNNLTPGHSFPGPAVEQRDSFSALMNDETLSNNLWNFSEFGGLSDSDNMLSQVDCSMNGQMALSQNSMQQMCYSQNSSNFLPQTGQSSSSKQGSLHPFPSGQPGMTSTPGEGTHNSQDNKIQQGVISNSQSFSNSPSGISQRNYPGFSGYSQQGGFPQQSFSGSFSSSYSSFPSQSSPKTGSGHSSTEGNLSDRALRSPQFSDGVDSAIPNNNFLAHSNFPPSYSGSNEINNDKRPKGQISDHHHMSGSGGMLSVDPQGKPQVTLNSSPESSLFSNSQPVYQNYSRSSGGSDSQSLAFSSHSYHGSQSASQYYNSQNNFSGPDWGQHVTELNSNTSAQNPSNTKTPKKRGPKKKKDESTSSTATKKKTSTKKSTKKAVVDGSPAVSVAPPSSSSSSLGSVLQRSNSFQPRGPNLTGGNLLEKLLMANEEEDKKGKCESRSQVNAASTKTLSSPTSSFPSPADSGSLKSGGSRSSLPPSNSLVISPPLDRNSPPESHHPTGGPHHQTPQSPQQMVKPMARVPQQMMQPSKQVHQQMTQQLTAGNHHLNQGPHFVSQGPNQLSQGPHQMHKGHHQVNQAPHSVFQGPHQVKPGPSSITSNPNLNSAHYLSPFREKTPDKDRLPQSVAAKSLDSLFSLQNLVSTVSQKTQFGQNVRQIATDGKPYSCSESELRSYIKKNIGPVETPSSLTELVGSSECEIPSRKPSNVSELIRSKLEVEAKKQTSMSVSDLPTPDRRWSTPGESLPGHNTCSPGRNGATNAGHPSVGCVSDRDSTVSSSSRASLSSVDSIIRDKSSSDSSSITHPYLMHSEFVSPDQSFSPMSNKCSAPSGGQVSSRERTMSMSSVNSNRTEFSRSLKQKSSNRPSLVRSFSTPTLQPPRRKRGRPRKESLPPVVNQPSKYTYSFVVPAPVFKTLQFIPLKHRSHREKVQVVRMHPMDARRYSLLKIGREVVKLNKLTEKQIGKLTCMNSTEVSDPMFRDSSEQLELMEKSIERTNSPKLSEQLIQRREGSESNELTCSDSPKQLEASELTCSDSFKQLEASKLMRSDSFKQSEACEQSLPRRNTLPLVSPKKAYPSYEELREEVAKSKGVQKLVAEKEQPFAELWCVEDKGSEPQPIEKVTLASIIDKAFSSMCTEEDREGGRDRGDLRGETSNRQGSGEERPRGKERSQQGPNSKYQAQFFKYLQRTSDMPLPIDDPMNSCVKHDPKATSSKTVPKKNKLKLNRRHSLVIDPDQEETPDPVLRDVSLTEASNGTNTPVQSQTPVTGRSPARHQGEPYRLFDSDILDPRIKSSTEESDQLSSEEGESRMVNGSVNRREDNATKHLSQDTGMMEFTDSKPHSESGKCHVRHEPAKNSASLTHEPHLVTCEQGSSASVIDSDESFHIVNNGDLCDSKQMETSKSVLNLSVVPNTSPTMHLTNEKSVQSPQGSENGPPSNTGSDLENMLPASDNKRELEQEVRKSSQFEGHMTRSRSSSANSSRQHSNDDKVRRKNSSESETEKTKKNASRQGRKRKREIPGVDYFVTGKFKGHKRMTVQLKKLNISNGTVVKLSQVFSLNSLFQKNGSNHHKTVQAPVMAAHESFCDNIFEKFKSFHSSKFFGNIVSDDSSKDSTYFQPRKSRLSLPKRSRPSDDVIEISSSDDERQPMKSQVREVSESVICVEEDEYDDEMEDEKESCDEKSTERNVKLSQKSVRKKRKTNKCRKIHAAFNGASYRNRRKRSRSHSGKLMTSLSLLHQATLANLLDTPTSYCESTDDYRTKYDDALFSMALYSPLPPEELEKSPPRAQSPTDLQEISGTPHADKTNLFDDLYRALMSDDESRSPVWSPVKTSKPVIVNLEESPLKEGTRQIQADSVTSVDKMQIDKIGNSKGDVRGTKSENKDVSNCVNSLRNQSDGFREMLDQFSDNPSGSTTQEDSNYSDSFCEATNHQSKGAKLGPLHFKRKAIVKVRPLTELEIKRYCLRPVCGGKENIPVVSDSESFSPPDLGPPIIPKYGKDYQEESEGPPDLIRNDSLTDQDSQEFWDSEERLPDTEVPRSWSSDRSFNVTNGAQNVMYTGNSQKGKETNKESSLGTGRNGVSSENGMRREQKDTAKEGSQERATRPAPQPGGGGKGRFRSTTPSRQRILKPKQPPPRRQRVEDTARQYGLQRVVNQDAFCSNADDVPEKPREVGGRVLTLQNNRVTSFLEYLSTVTGEGLAAFRQILAATDCILPSQTDNQTVMDSITKDHTLRCSLLGDRMVTMVPCKQPPSQAKVRTWLEKKEQYRQQKKKEKPGKQQEASAQENQFTRIIPHDIVPDTLEKDKNNMKTPKHRLLTREVSFNDTTEIFNMDDDSYSPVKQNGVSGQEVITEEIGERKSSSQDSEEENVISPSPPQQTRCSFRRNESDIISPSPQKPTHFSFRRNESDVISPSPPKLTSSSVRRSSQQLGNPLRSRLSDPGVNKQPCEAVRRNLIGSVHSTPVSARDQRSLLETINVTPISHRTDEDKGVMTPATQTPGVFQTPRRIPQSKTETAGPSDPRRSLMSSAEMRDLATPTNSKGNTSQIDGPTPKNSFGFKVSQHDFQKAKALHEVQNLTVMSLELHAETRRDLMPDPEVDPILAVFYNILNDVTMSGVQREVTGVILVDKKSKESQLAMKNRKRKRNPTSPQLSHDSGSEVTSPQPSTSSDRPPSPQPSTSTAQPPPQRGKRARSVSPTPRPCAKVPRGEDVGEIEATLLQRSGVNGDLEVTYVESEEELFTEVLKIFSKWDPDILVGYEIQRFSWGYLFQRASHLSVNLCAQMSRIPDEKKKSSFKAESDEWGADYSSEIHLAGRVILNLWRILKHEVTLNIYTFENVAHHVLHMRVPKFSLQTLNSWFKHRTHLYRWRFIKNYITRVQGNLKLIDQLDLIGRTSEFARVFGIEFYHVLSRGSQYRVESMMLRLAKPMNFIPASPGVQQRARMRAPECIPLTLEPESRFYADPVVVVDFQSLYPSIMIAHNYCFSTCVGRLDFLERAHEGPIEFGCTHLRISPKTLNRIKNDVTVSPNGVVFVKEHVRKGIISKMVEEILNTRIMVKKSMKEHKDNKGLHRLLDARQLGLKLIANVTYGYTGANFSGRMPCIEVGDSIVRKARETLERAIKLVEERKDWGARVVYGDTDSMFIEMKGCSKDEAFRIGYEICEAVTAMNPKPIKLKFEKVFYPCVLQTKKRYVGYSYETPDQKEPIFDAKGIETVRRDSCAAVSKILERSIKILFGCKDVSKVKEYVLRQCRKFMEGKVSMQDCVFAKEYRGMKGYKPGACVPALEIAKKTLRQDRRAEPRTGERVPYVIVYGSPGLPLIQLVRQPQDVLADPSLRLNATYYITKQILPPLDRIFSLLGVDVFSWYNDMPKVVRVVPQSLLSTDQRKGTISQYFSATNCPVCDKQTNQAICNICVKDPQNVCVTLCDRIRRWEKVYHDLVQVCNTCMGVTDENQPCMSLDCPIMFRRVLAKQDVQKGTQLREVVSKVLDF
ncbi:uncharacterized protein LOC111104775 [Crassostrea virginica]